ncbi:hypothetical protein [Chitinophaga sp.]|uniref:hypothetical protein n=1 Tax=Chitinophaga sp. TaxID=1869181 RepID=UPI002CB13F3D|nr:hypothetical protein [Chitinophaga sp.]HWV68959.1 hypothetical protein [Chitinophaga sp.]
MKHNKALEDKLREILKEEGMEKPTDFFSGQLVRAVVQQQKNKAAKGFKVETWLGKFILGLLVLLHFLFLYRLNTLREQPVLFFSIVAFIAGTWGVIVLIRKILPTGAGRL